MRTVHDNSVLVVSRIIQPLMPTSSAKARLFLKRGKAVVLRRYPFTILLKDRSIGDTQQIRLKIDPGSKETGVTLVNEVTKQVLFALELTHRSQSIKARLESRRLIRRFRRNRNTRYRKQRFLNRRRPEDWLPPSLRHRIETIMTWIGRLSRFAPVSSLSQELVRFDLQKMENPEISGIEYQQGTLPGFEVREYLLEKWGRTCAYCGAENIPLQIEHIQPKSRGGTNRISNLCISCKSCNFRKGTQDIRDFLRGNTETLKRIEAQAKRPLRDATAVNATRFKLLHELRGTGLPVEFGSGGHIKFNRSIQGYPKQHWIDAACVGNSGERIILNPSMPPLLVKAVGHGNRQMCGTDAFGFPKRHRTNQKTHFGFQTGDIVKAVVPNGKKKGVYVGKVLCRATGYFDIKNAANRTGGINQKYCSKVHAADGYSYSTCFAFHSRIDPWAYRGGVL